MAPPRRLLTSRSLGRRSRHDQRYSSTHSDSASSDSDSDTSSTDTDSSGSTNSSNTSTSSREEAESKNLSPATKRAFAIIIGLFLLVAFAVLLVTATDDKDPPPPTPSKQPTTSRTTPILTKTGSSSTAKETASKPIDTSKPLGVSRALPEKLRGVNLGSLFILEPWMAGEAWKTLGCTDFKDEWTCNEANGLDKMQSKWEHHWDTFYTVADFEEMAKLGLNSVRIPIGYWIVDSMIGGDYFASGSFHYLKQILRWCKASSLAVCLDLHSVPGMGTKGESFTGHIVETPEFFKDENYEKAYQVLRNLTISSHTDEDFSTVVMIMVVNEPLHDPPPTLTSVYYPGAQKAIREAEEKLGISCKNDREKCLGIQFMGKTWGSGDPTTHIDMTDRVFFDDHNYAQWIVAENQQTTSDYLDYSCTNTRSTDLNGTITGEWSLSTIGINEGLDDAFYKEFFLRQVANFERGSGWFFWSWKTQLNSPQWGFQQAVAAGYIPSDLSVLDTNACNDGQT